MIRREDARTNKFTVDFLPIYTRQVDRLIASNIARGEYQTACAIIPRSINQWLARFAAQTPPTPPSAAAPAIDGGSKPQSFAGPTRNSGQKPRSSVPLAPG